MLRLRSGGLTSKNGFSVVAPMSVSVPSSTAGSRASCWAFENRWISSRNRIVPRPCSPSRRRARSMHVAHVLHAGGDRRHLLEGAFGRAGDGERQRGLAGARRTPEDRRRQAVELDEAAQRAAGSDEVLLADDLVDRARPEAGGERRLGTEPVRDRCGEQVVRHPGHATERQPSWPVPGDGRRRARGQGPAVARPSERHDVVDQPVRLDPPPRRELGAVGRRLDRRRRRRRRRTIDAPVRGACCRARGGATRRRSSPGARRLSTTSRRTEPGLLGELAPRRLDRRLPRLEPTLGQLPLAGEIGPFERQDQPVVAAHDGHDPGAESADPAIVGSTTSQRPSARSRSTTSTYVGSLSATCGTTAPRRRCRRRGRTDRPARTTGAGGGRGHASAIRVAPDSSLIAPLRSPRSASDPATTMRPSASDLVGRRRCCERRARWRRPRPIAEAPGSSRPAPAAEPTDGLMARAASSSLMAWLQRPMR